MADHGTAFETRFALMRERIEAMKVIWSESKPEYHGDFVDFEPMMTWPKPVQQPHPPIHVGGIFPYGARRAIRYGDGWMPIGGRGPDPIAAIPEFHELARRAGRDPAKLEVTIFAQRPDELELRRCADAGVSRVVFGLPSAARDEILPLLDRCAELKNKVG